MQTIGLANDYDRFRIRVCQKERTRRRAEKRSTKGYAWRVRFFSAPLRFSGVLRASLKGGEKKRTLQKHPFGRPFLRTAPSLLPWRTPTEMGDSFSWSEMSLL